MSLQHCPPSWAWGPGPFSKGANLVGSEVAEKVVAATAQIRSQAQELPNAMSAARKEKD